MTGAPGGVGSPSGRPPGGPASPSGRPSDSAFPLWLLAITVVAAALRLLHLDAQVFTGDEVHTLRVIRAAGGGKVSIEGLEPYVPLGRLYFALGHVVPLSEWTLRAPMLLCGILLPALAALAARRFVSRDAALLLGMWLAIHPLLILYSRVVRPYGLAVPLLLSTLFLLDRWFESPRVRTLAGAVVCAALASWLHLLALVTAGLIFLGTLLRALLPEGDRSRDLRRAGAVVAAGLGCLALVTLLFAPLLGDVRDQVLVGKVGQGALDAEGVWDAAAMLTGVPGRLPALAFLAGVTAGLVALGRSLGPRSLVLIVPALGQPLLIFLIRPQLLEYPMVMARYHLYALPLWLLAASAVVAGGLSLVAARAPAVRGGLVPSAGACLFAVLLWVGPFSTIYTRGNSFAHDPFFQRYRHLAGAARWRVEGSPAPLMGVHRFYRQMSDDVPAVLEWPLNPALRYAAAQAVHGRPVKLVWTSDWGPSVVLANIVQIPKQLAELAPGMLVVLHKTRGQLGPEGEGLATLMRRRYGPPVFEDGVLVAFEVRKRGAGGVSGSERRARRRGRGRPDDGSPRTR